MRARTRPDKDLKTQTQTHERTSTRARAYRERDRGRETEQKGFDGQTDEGRTDGKRFGAWGRGERASHKHLIQPCPWFYQERFA
eukprot:972005-Pleurochrysis_carterae.AAC.2